MSFNTSSFINIPLEGLIWKLLPDDSGLYLLVEYRNDKKRKVDFLCIDMNIKKILWQGTEIKELWWLGLKDVVGDKVIVHGYKNSKSPEHKGIYVIDILSGKLLWTNKDLSYVYSLSGFIIAGNDDPDNPVLVKLDIQSGVPVQTAQIDVKQNTLKSGYVLPVMYTSDSNHFMTIATFISQQLNALPVSAIEYMEYASRIIVSFYVSVENSMTNFITVFNEDGKLLLQEELGSALTGIGQDSFFIYGSSLVYIKNKSELVIRDI